MRVRMVDLYGDTPDNDWIVTRYKDILISFTINGRTMKE